VLSPPGNPTPTFIEKTSLLGIFHRDSIATVIDCVISLLGEPNADYAWCTGRSGAEAILQICIGISRGATRIRRALSVFG
jgi:hypothetical protein